jgi:uncharacterized protein YecE (DUF72 family)
MIGCSGFYYKHWKGVFYPEDLPQRNWFPFYCQYFNTLELNNTFYSFPKASSLQKWYDESPEHFVFTVKAHRVITHYKKFNNVIDRVNELYDVTGHVLKEKLGPVLFQLPPNFHYSDEHLQKMISNLDPAFTNVVEMRHESWWKPEVYQELAKYGITYCGMSHPTLPANVVANTETLYYRMHGNQQLYASAYSREELLQLRDKVKETNVKQAFIYFNNDIGASAIFNAKELKELVK